MKKLVYVFTVSLLLITIAFTNSMAAHNKQQKQHWGTPYSIAYLAKHHKLAEANKAFNYTRIFFNIYLPQGTSFIHWTVTFEDGTNTYTLNTDPYGFNYGSSYDYSWSGIPQGTYTVTVHNQSYANNYYFDAVCGFTDANNENQAPYYWDKNTDNSDFVFQNVYVPGDPGTSIDLSLSAHH
ncbi:hypothetical protein [Mucilaginibacter aquatilis]|uniref:Uncharacterized protein n=1 Tax=Mucilaginibacter aquatilis TaxID=1517760 RepID=A0A6I4I5U4_9SPHI|nr:hypothetical protein [Mucilaginibacter aquatilis]MVN90565.1 hypothetical protein [Mucilaginibacter aquatilis]